MQKRLQEWVLEIGLMHVESKAINEAAIQGSCRNLRVTKEDQLAHDFMLTAAAGAEPEAPATPAQPLHRHPPANPALLHAPVAWPGHACRPAVCRASGSTHSLVPASRPGIAGMVTSSGCLLQELCFKQARGRTLDRQMMIQGWKVAPGWTGPAVLQSRADCSLVLHAGSRMPLAQQMGRWMQIRILTPSSQPVTTRMSGRLLMVRPACTSVNEHITPCSLAQLSSNTA